MEWTPARIRLLRDVAFCQSQDGFAKTLGFDKQAIGKAERGTHAPGLALRRALDQAFHRMSDIQRDRFLAAVAAEYPTATPGPPSVDRRAARFGSAARGSSVVAPDHPARVLHDVRNAMLGPPLLVPMSASAPVALGPTNVAIHQLSVQSLLGNARKAAQIAESIDTDVLPAVLRGRRSQVHLEMGWVAAGQADDALAVLHLLEEERVAEQTVSRNASARTLINILMARERRSDTPGLRGLAARAGLLP